MNLSPIQTFVIAFSVVSFSMTLGQTASAQEKITFDDHIKPIFRQRCASCHNPNKKSAGLDLTNYTNLMQGGAGGAAVEPGNAGDSYIYAVITHAEEPVMPPNGNKIPEGEIKLIEKWIDGGVLETQTSVAKINKPKFELAAGANPNARPETPPVPPRLPLEPEFVSQRASNANAIATSPWAPIVAVGMSRQILLYNTSSQQLVGVLPYPEGQVYKLKFSRSGDVLIAGGGKDSASGNVVGWSVRTGDRVFEVGDEFDAVMAADVSPDHSMVALGGPSKMIRVYSTADGSLIYETKKHTDWITSIEFSPDGVLLATGDRNGGLFVWEAETGNEYLPLNGHSKQITAVSWRSDANLLVSTSEDATTRLWEMENGQQVKSWNSHGGGSTSVDFTRDGNILTSGRDNLVKLWKQDGGMIRQFAGLTDIAISCGYCDETSKVIAGDWSGQLGIWNGADGQSTGNLTTNPPALNTRLSLATTHQEKLQQEFETAKSSFQQIDSQLAEVTKTLESSSASLQTTANEMTTTQSALNKAHQDLESVSTAIANTQKTIEDKTAAVPLLNESRSQAQAAVEKLPDDEELKQTVAKLTEKISRIEAEIAQQNSEIQQATQKRQTIEKNIDDLGAQLTQHQSKSEEMNQKVTQLQNEKQPLEEKHLQSKTHFEKVAQQLKTAEQNVARWQSEINFFQQLKVLQEKLSSAEAAYGTQQKNVEEANLKLQEAEAAAEKAKAAEKEARNAIEAVQKKINEAKQIK